MHDTRPLLSLKYGFLKATIRVVFLDFGLIVCYIANAIHLVSGAYTMTAQSSRVGGKKGLPEGDVEKASRRGGTLLWRLFVWALMTDRVQPSARRGSKTRKRRK